MHSTWQAATGSNALTTSARSCIVLGAWSFAACEHSIFAYGSRTELHHRRADRPSCGGFESLSRPGLG